MATTNTSVARKVAYGALNSQIIQFTVGTTDTSATILAPSIAEIVAIFIGNSVVLTAAPTFAGNVATLSFNVTTSNTNLTALVLGR